MLIGGHHVLQRKLVNKNKNRYDCKIHIQPPFVASAILFALFPPTKIPATAPTHNTISPKGILMVGDKNCNNMSCYWNIRTSGRETNNLGRG